MTVLPITSTPRKPYPSEVAVPAGTAGFTKDSLILAHQIRTISKNRIIRLYGYLTDPQIQDRVHDAILDHLDIGFDED